MLVEEKLQISVEANAGWDPRIRSVKCGEMVRSYLIKTERFLLVYDTLLGPKSGKFLRSEALDFGDGRPLLVVNSHADWDHYFGNMCFPETILGTETMVRRVSGNVGRKELAKKRAEHPESYNSVKLVAPTIGVSSNTTLHGGDLTLELKITKGHRPDHLSIYIPEIATLFPGDCVEDPIPLVDEDSDESSRTIAELINSLKKFLDPKPEWVLANHAKPQANSERILQNLAYLENLREQASQFDELEDAIEALKPDDTWDDFYQKAHSNQVRMAWQQYKRDPSKWAAD